MFDNKVVSIDLGSKNFHIVEGVYKGSLLEIDKMAEFPAPTNCIIDGRIEDKIPLKDALRTSLAQNGIKSRNITLVIQSGSVINREFILPEVKNDQLENMVKYEMEQFLPENSSGYAIEFKVLGKIMEENSSKLKIRAASMPKDLVASYFDLLQELKFKPGALDVHSNASSKIFEKAGDINGEGYNIEQTVSVIDFGYKSTNINIISKGILEFSRTVSYGSRDIDTALSSFYDVQLDKAEQMKMQELNIARLEDTSDTGEGISASVRSIMQQWMSELQKVFQYYINRNPGNKINKVYIHGGGANLKGMSEYMKHYHGIGSVQKISSISSVKMKSNMASPDIGNYLNAIGAMIRL